MARAVLAHTQAAGFCFVASAVLVLVGTFTHPPGEGETVEKTQSVAKDDADLWITSHWLFGFGFLLLAAGAILLLTVPNRLTEVWPLAMSWGVIAVASLVLFFAGAVESTGAARAAAQDDADAFAAWYSLAHGLFFTGLFLAAGLLVVAFAEAQDPKAPVPAWASWIAVFSLLLLAVYFLGSVAFGNPEFGPLILAIVPSILWVLWVGAFLAMGAKPARGRVRRGRA